MKRPQINPHVGGQVISIKPEVSWEDASPEIQRRFKIWTHAEVSAAIGIKRRALIDRINQLRRSHPDYDPLGLGGKLTDFQRWFLIEVDRQIYKPNLNITNAEAARLVHLNQSQFSKERYEHETRTTRYTA
ncbi:MAG: hypothetical protein ACM37W_00265 [Actinomycetota bacterium]